MRKPYFLEVLKICKAQSEDRRDEHEKNENRSYYIIEEEKEWSDNED